jgi:deazaflavin-dependent oxidoreductase (nitroreductase family)
VVASKAGAPRHPFWYRNLVANPLVELQDAAVKQKMRAREVFGREKDEWWKRTDAAYSMFPTYRACAGVRSGARPGTSIELWTSSRLAVLSTGVFDR